MTDFSKSCVAAFLIFSLFLFSGCQSKMASPADAVLSLLATEKLPVGRLYDSEAAAHERYAGGSRKISLRPSRLR